MSLIPPNAVLLNKFYFFLKKHFQGEELENILQKCGPFPLFKISCEIRYNVFPDFVKEEDKGKYLEFEKYKDDKIYECVDECLNSFVRMRKELENEGQYTGFVKLMMEYMDLKTPWTGLLLSEINIGGNKVL